MEIPSVNYDLTDSYNKTKNTSADGKSIMFSHFCIPYTCM